QCHADFRWICVTPKKYNGSITAWDKVKAHLEGIWHDIVPIISTLYFEPLYLQILQHHKGHLIGPLAFCQYCFLSL
ncbi:hypothetical protein ACVWOM_30040, partial [Pseudomonas aeruginosa]